MPSCGQISTTDVPRHTTRPSCRVSSVSLYWSSGSRMYSMVPGPLQRIFFPEPRERQLPRVCFLLTIQTLSRKLAWTWYSQQVLRLVTSSRKRSSSGAGAAFGCHLFGLLTGSFLTSKTWILLKCSEFVECSSVCVCLVFPHHWIQAKHLWQECDSSGTLGWHVLSKCPLPMCILTTW